MFPLLRIHQISEPDQKANGDSTLIEYIDHFVYKNILIDCGYRKDTVVNYLKERGIIKVDLLIASHLDQDHIGGMKNVLEDVNVEEMWIMNINILKRFIESADGFDHEKQHMLYNIVAGHESIVIAKDKNVRCFSTYEGHTTLIGKLFIEVLWPPLLLEDFLKNHNNMGNFLRKGKAQTYKNYLERELESRNIQTEVFPQKDVKRSRGIYLEELSWVEQYSERYGEYNDEVFEKNYNLASRGLFNDISIVVRIVVLSDIAHARDRPPFTMLFPGDLEKWDYLFLKYGWLYYVDLLKIPHHGSKIKYRGSSIYRFFKPKISLVFPLPQHDLPNSLVRNDITRTGILSCTFLKKSSKPLSQTNGCCHRYGCSAINTGLFEIDIAGIKVVDGRNICRGRFP